MTRLHNLSKEQLYAFIEGKKTDLSTFYEDVCEAIWELETRCKDKHPMQKHLYCQFYKQVHNKTLLIGMIQALEGKPRLLAHMEGRPLELQDALAKGQLVILCRLSKDGSIEEIRLPIAAFVQRDLQVAFPIGKPPATISEQRAHLEAKLAAMPKPNAQAPAPACKPTVDQEKSVARNLPSEMRLEDMAALLREAGFEVRLPAAA